MYDPMLVLVLYPYRWVRCLFLLVMPIYGTSHTFQGIYSFIVTFSRPPLYFRHRTPSAADSSASSGRCFSNVEASQLFGLPRPSQRCFTEQKTY